MSLDWNITSYAHSNAYEEKSFLFFFFLNMWHIFVIDYFFTFLFSVSYRSDREFLYQILGEVIKAGATTLNIPDTVGYTLPPEFGQLIADIKANTPGIENVIISTHCQNDLGLSTANTLAVCNLFSFAYNTNKLVLSIKVLI